MGAGGLGEARGVDGEVAAVVAVEDERAAEQASLRATMTLCESYHHYWYHLCSPYPDQCSQHHRSLCAHVHCVETVPAVEPACQYLEHWNCKVRQMDGNMYISNAHTHMHTDKHA